MVTSKICLQSKLVYSKSGNFCSRVYCTFKKCTSSSSWTQSRDDVLYNIIMQLWFYITSYKILLLKVEKLDILVVQHFRHGKSCRLLC